jgi:glycosyltransferase involved in cell wall biosynthesis
MSEGNPPLVTVVIPVYNGTNYLREAIESALTQTYQNTEVIVVNDGSTDDGGTRNIALSYGERIRYFEKKNGGVASAINYGICQAKGSYIAWLSHDDCFLPEKLASQVYLLQEFKQFSACYTDYYVIDAAGNTISEIETPWYPQGQALRALFGNMYISGSTMLIDRTCFDKVGLFSEELKYTQDGEMWLRLIRNFDIGRLPEKLIKQRSHSEQGSVRLKNSHRDETKSLFRRVFDEWGVAAIFPEYAKYMDNPKMNARAHTWLGDTMAFHRGFFDLADEQYRKSTKLWPSLRNPARLKIIFGSRLFFFPKRLYYYFMFRMFSSRFPTIIFHDK